MCGRKIITSDADLLGKTFNVEVAPEIRVQLKPSYNVCPGQLHPVITQEAPNRLQLFYWGLTPAWSKKRMYLINARAEGKNNQENSQNYTGEMGIAAMPSFRDPVKKYRCLVPVDAFYEGNEVAGLDKPYLCYMTTGHPFALAGIYSIWMNFETGEPVSTYAVITSYPNELTQAIGHHRCPVVIKPQDYSIWLNPTTPIAQVTSMLKPPPANEMNAYPVSTRVKSVKNNDQDLIVPLGHKIFE